MVSPTFFNLSLNLTIRSSWSEPQSAPGLVFADCIELLHLGWENIINLILVLTIWWCPCVESSLVLSEEGVCYEWCVLLTKLFYPLPCFILHSMAKFVCYSRYLLTFYYFCIPVPYDEKDIFFFFFFFGVHSSVYISQSPTDELCSPLYSKTSGQRNHICFTHS